MKNDIDKVLPASGPGFVTFNRGTGGANQYGLASTIEAILRVTKAWSLPLMSIGHISRKGGGPFPPHKSHRTGLDVDVRPIRRDRKNLSVTITDKNCDSKMTKNMAEHWWHYAPVQLILFNDPEIIKVGLSRPYPGHTNHLHIRLRPTGATLKEGHRGSDVEALQRKLNIPPDGRFGPATTKAVKAFQKSKGLIEDGIAGEAMQRLLNL